MTEARSQPRGRPRTGGAASWRLLTLVALAAVGLIAMHQLAGAAGSPQDHAVTQAQTDATDRVCHHPADCPDDRHGHPGQICQANPNPTAAVAAPDLVTHGRPPVLPPAVTPSTTDQEAGDGSGCGPPGRADLSVWRI